MHANGTIDEHVPQAWITNDLRRQIFNRDYLKKKAVSINDPEAWDQYTGCIKKIYRWKSLAKLTSA